MTPNDELRWLEELRDLLKSGHVRDAVSKVEARYYSVEDQIETEANAGGFDNAHARQY